MNISQGKLQKLPGSPLSSKYFTRDSDTDLSTKDCRGVFSLGAEAPGTNIGPEKDKEYNGCLAKIHFASFGKQIQE